MIPARRCIPSITTSMVSLTTFIVLVAIAQIEKVHGFSSRTFHPTPSALTIRTRNGMNSSLKAVGSNSLVAVTDSNYRELFEGEKFLLLDAFAQWCGPCKLIEPVLQQCADDWKDSLVVGKFDVEDGKSKDLKVELILQGVMPQALPALILVHKNEILDTWKGVIDSNQLQEMLEKHVVVKNKHDVESSNNITNKNNSYWTSDANVENAGVAKTTFRGIGLVNDF